MNKQLSVISALLAASLLAVGCTSAPSKSTTGTVVGGVAGGVLGNQFGKGNGKTAMTALGAVAGSLIGQSIGAHMDEMDRMRTQEALNSRPVGSTMTWRNPDSGHEYSVTPTRTYYTGETPCREYTMKAVIDGRPQNIQGTACRTANGNWKTT